MPATEHKAASTWSSVVLRLPPEVLQLPPEVLQLPPEVLSFSLNTAQDRLLIMPTWHCGGRKMAYQMCALLCRMRQMLSHVLSQCPVSLHLRRYNTRHDAVLEVIKRSIMPRLTDADLHSHQPHRPHQSPP